MEARRWPSVVGLCTASVSLSVTWCLSAMRDWKAVISVAKLFTLHSSEGSLPVLISGISDRIAISHRRDCFERLPYVLCVG